MQQVEVFSKNIEAYEAWYKKYPEVYESELAAIKEHFSQLPENLRGIEIGLGTGKFSKPLGIKEGIEPSKEMAEVAVKRGIEVVNAFAENLPYADIQFDFVLYVTICHLNSFRKSLKQSYRVLKPGGSLIVGFLDKNQSAAKLYEEKRKQSTFYRNARFYSTRNVVKLINESGFKDPVINQTLFGKLDEIDRIQIPRPGYGEGSFVVIKATKK